MSEYIELISQLVPKNNGNFPLADVNDLKGGYIQVDTIAEMEAFLSTTKLKEGMLCYVKNDITNRHMYQYIGSIWIPWVYALGGGNGISIQTVQLLSELDAPDYKITGQLVFVREVDGLRYYNGSTWNSFSRIYIQSSPPDDKGGIWIDTAEDNKFFTSNRVIQDLLQVISILQTKVSKLEWAFKSQLDFGGFTNNQYYDYDNSPSIEPTFGTSDSEDTAQQAEDLLTGIISDVEPIGSKDILPNGTHLCLKSGTYEEMMVNKSDFLPKELLWCWDRQQLWIKDPRTLNLVQIGSSSGTGDTTDTQLMEQILTEVFGTGSAAKTKIIGIEFADMMNKSLTYTVQVANGQLEVVDQRLDISTLAGNTQTSGFGNYYTAPYFPIISNSVGMTTSPKIYINMVYTGGDNNEFSYGGASHNFVELCNLGNTDLNLKGMYLHYTEKATGRWVSLPLKGVLKSQGTFLIRGARSAVPNINTTILKVNTFDMEWTKDASYNSGELEITEDIGAGVSASTIWDQNNLIKFNTNCALYLSGADSADYYKTNVLNTNAPYNNTEKSCLKWYVDLVGIGVEIPAEGSPVPNSGQQYLHLRYYHMDPVSQATKAFNVRNNSKDWFSLDLSNIPPEYNGEDFTPKASFETKTIFFNKDLLQKGAPQIITCTFGYNAHTTRCFNWISVDYYNEFIQIIPENGTYTETLGVDMFESFKAGDGRDTINNRGNAIYNRIREVSTDGTPFTVHKFIKDFPEPEIGTTKVYKYKVGRPGAWSEEYEFTMRNRDDVRALGFNFLQVSDEQGFTEEEYEVVKLTTEFIEQDQVTNNYTYDFICQTGDITQNGNRFNEWINYFNGRKSMLSTKEFMYLVGNNDLSPVDIHKLGVGDDWSKSNPINVTYFFTFEHPFTIPTSTGGSYIPSVYSFIYGNTFFLVMNSEITSLTISDVISQDEAVNIYSDTLKAWCDAEVSRIDSDPKISWRISLTHEAPFTLLTAEQIMKYVNKTTLEINSQIERGGSHLNTVGAYWYSKFLQDNKFNVSLCGHKHTYTNSRYLRESEGVNETMKPVVYEPQLDSAPWYIALPEREKRCCQLSLDNTKWYVKYVMAQATGYKLASNKEAPAKNIPWLLEYYPVTKQLEDLTTNTATITVNPAQSYPHYIIWNVGVGTEGESPTDVVDQRPRIKGNCYKITKKLSAANVTWPVFQYKSRAKVTDLERKGGNGDSNPNNNIIIDKLFT